MTEPPILLCYPPAPEHIMADRESAYGMGKQSNALTDIQAPHTLAWCGALLQQHQWPVTGLDATVERLNQDETLTRIARQAPAVLVLLVSPHTAQSDLRFIEAVRHQLPKIRILLVGAATRYLPPALVRASDMVLMGEPEGAIQIACEQLLAHDGTFGALWPQAFAPSAYDQRGRLLEIRHLPPPAWHLFPVKRYKKLPIVASRGCTQGCRYCAAPVTQGNLIRQRTAEHVAKEMLLLYHKNGVRNFHFIDPLFAADRAHTLALCNALIQLGATSHLNWQCETRPEQLDLLLLKRMSQAGCQTIDLGLETISPHTLIATKRLKNEMAVQDYLSHVRQILLGCRDFGITCRIHVMAGLPGDSSAATATRAFLRAYAPAEVQVNPLVPHPGTSIFPTNRIKDEIALLEKVTEQPTPRRKKATWWQALTRVAHIFI